MTKYSIILIKWDILNKDKIGKKLWKKNIYNRKSSLYININYNYLHYYPQYYKY